MEDSVSSTSAGGAPPSRTATETAPVVSHTVLEQRANDLGEESVEAPALANLVSIFLETASDEIPALQQHAGDGDLEAAEDRAHRLKGGSATVGAEAFSGLCQTIERAAREGWTDVVEENAEKLPGLLRQTRAEFREALGTHFES